MKFKTLQKRSLAPVFKPYKAIDYMDASLPFRGFDTETNKNGDLVLLASDHDCIWTTNTLEAIEFLYKHGRGHSGNNNFFYNIHFDVRAIIKQYLTTVSKSDALRYVRAGRFTIGNYHVRYIKDKMLSISTGKSGHKVFFSDIAQFYGGSLDSNAQKFLGVSKADMNTDFDVSDISKIPKSDLEKRCKTDALLTKQLAERFVASMSKFMKPPRVLFSKAYLAESALTQYVDMKYLRTFTPHFLDVHAQEYAYRSYKGGIFDLRVKGKVSDAFEMDVVSQYPHKIRDLPDLTNGSWYYVTKPTETVFFGFYHVKMQFNRFSPYRYESGLIIYPALSTMRDNYITRPELEDLRREGYQIEVIDGYEYKHDGDIVYPFRELIDKLYALKERAQKENDESARSLYKIIMNSIYGKFAQARHGIGRLLNPAYASYITALSRLQIKGYAEKYYDEIYEIATDAVVGKLKPEIKIEDLPKGLGSFEPKKTQHSTRLLLQTGVTFDENNELFRYRGASIAKSKLKEFNKFVRIVTKRPLNLSEAIIQNRTKEINKFIERKKVLRINDQKQIWNDGKEMTMAELHKQKIVGEPIDDAYLEAYEGKLCQTDKQIQDEKMLDFLAGSGSYWLKGLYLKDKDSEILSQVELAKIRKINAIGRMKRLKAS